MIEPDEIDKILDTVPSLEINDIVGAVLSDAEFDLQKNIQEVLPYTKRVSANDIVPSEYQDRLMALDWAMSQCFWEIGDITEELVNSVDRQRSALIGKVVTKTDIYEAVGYFCHRTSRSVRYYWEVAHFFPPDMRKKYEVSFFVWAKARWVKEPAVLLDIAVANPQWSADRVRMEYYKQVGEALPVREGGSADTDASVPVCADQDVPVFRGMFEDNNDMPLPQAGEAWTGQSPGRFKQVILSRLDHSIDNLREVLDRIPMPTDLRVRIGNSILELQNIGIEVRRLG